VSKARLDDERVARQLEMEVAEVVLARPRDDDLPRLGHSG
jgi:hypothetical protein